MRRNQVLDAMVELLSRETDVKTYEIVHGRGHPKIAFTFKDTDYLVPYAGTPSDANAPAQAARDLRKLLGLKTPRRRKTAAKKSKPVASRKATPDLTLTDKPDWRAELAVLTGHRVEEPGVYLDLPEVAYHADPCPFPSVSRSFLHTFMDRSPIHAWMEHPRLNGAYEPTRKRIFDIGSAAHDALLLRGENIVVIPADDYRTVDARSARDAAYDQGLIPLLRHEYQQIESMVAAARWQLMRHPYAKDALQGAPEATLIWREGSLWCRARLDDRPASGPVFYDFKTAIDASPRTWPAQAINKGLHLQAAWYRRGIRALLGIDDPIFRFLVQDKEPPYTLMVYEMAPETLGIADEMIDAALPEIAQCLRTESWPGYATDVHYVEAPPWAIQRWEDRKAYRTHVREQADSDALKRYMEFYAPHDHAPGLKGVAA